MPNNTLLKSLYIALFAVFVIFLHCGYWIKSKTRFNRKGLKMEMSFYKRKSKIIEPRLEAGQYFLRSVDRENRSFQKDETLGICASSVPNPNQTSAAHFLRQNYFVLKCLSLRTHTRQS